jgi:hypothetical protein
MDVILYTLLSIDAFLSLRDQTGLSHHRIVREVRSTSTGAKTEYSAIAFYANLK